MTREADVEAANEIYNAGKADGERLMAEADAAREFERSVGFLQKINIDGSYNKLLQFMTLYKIKEGKLYHHGNKTWDEFCTWHGLSARTVDANLADLKPILEQFSADFAEIFTDRKSVV